MEIVAGRKEKSLRASSAMDLKLTVDANCFETRTALWDLTQRPTQLQGLLLNWCTVRVLLLFTPRQFVTLET